MTHPSPQEVFYKHITKLIRNLLIQNPNYMNQLYFDESKADLKEATIERAKYILEEIERIKHLIDLEDT